MVIHNEIIEKIGGSHGIRDIGLFLSIVEKSKSSFGGKELYKGVFEKAAVYLESLAKFHVFVDGNKRTAIASAAYFLHLNGYELIATNKEVENFVVKVIVKKLDLETVTDWIKKNSRKEK